MPGLGCGPGLMEADTGEAVSGLASDFQSFEQWYSPLFSFALAPLNSTLIVHMSHVIYES